MRTQTVTRNKDDRSSWIGTRVRSGRAVLKSLKAKVALVALVAAAALGVLAAPAYGAAGPNTGGANCHGVWLSYLSTSGMSPGQLQKDFGTSAQDVQATADVVCGL
jgi:hypothetical protein